MKIRNGFVSNSSSSSFIVLKKDESLSLEDLKQKSIEVMKAHNEIQRWGWDEESQEWAEREAQKYAENNEYILLKERVEWGGEEAVGKIVPALLKILGADTNGISYKWDE